MPLLSEMSSPDTASWIARASVHGSIGVHAAVADPVGVTYREAADAAAGNANTDSAAVQATNAIRERLIADRLLVTNTLFARPTWSLSPALARRLPRPRAARRRRDVWPCARGLSPRDSRRFATAASDRSYGGLNSSL